MGLCVVGAADDDIALEAVVFIGTIALDSSASEVIAQTNVIESLMELMCGKQGSVGRYVP